MDDKTLRRKLIRLAYQRPELRPEILPLVTDEPRTAREMTPSSVTRGIGAAKVHLTLAEKSAKSGELDKADQSLGRALMELEKIRRGLEWTVWGGHRPPTY